jgi:hypothetical protein
MTSPPTHPPDPGGFEARIALLTGFGNGESPSLIVPD